MCACVSVCMVYLYISCAHVASFPVSPWATCFNRTSRSMAVRGKAHQGCLVYHVPANSTAATLPPVSPSTIPSTSPPASQATVISSPQATSPGLSLSPASVATESDSSSSSNASTTAARSEGVTTSDKLVLRGSGLSSTLLALVVVFVTVLLAVCLGGLAYLLHKRAGLRLKSMKEALGKVKYILVQDMLWSCVSLIISFCTLPFCVCLLAE